MPTDAARSVRDVCAAVRCYLRERPAAADTLIGIAQWWLPESMHGIPIERLRLALAHLVATNEVRCTILPDGSELYSRAVVATSHPEQGFDAQ